MAFEERGYWYLMFVWVVPCFQGRGVGRMLVGEVLDGDGEGRKVYVEAGRVMRGWFEGMGFEEVEGWEGAMILRASENTSGDEVKY